MENLNPNTSKSSVKNTIILLLACAFAVGSVTSCGTVRGIGHDVETVGNGIGQATR